ncbi:MAG: formate/nitrite transporter family protein [Bacilli bacterium]|nr:formate/nitrite transporter family protein [Bacilli bacterium]
MKKLLLSSFAAGISIGIAGLAFLKTGNAWVFPIGLLMVCFFSFYLFTGQVCYANVKDTSKLIMMLCMNIVGAVFLGIITHFAYPELAQKAIELVTVKFTEGAWVFPRAILCNIMIFVAVHGWKNLPAPNNIITLIFATAIFVLGGFEHCIANAYYFGCAGIFSTDILWYLPVNIIGNAIGGIGIYRTIKCLDRW